MFEVKIKNFEVFGYHGCYDIEKKNGQFFKIDIIYTLSNLSNSNDQIENTVDYIDVINYVEEIFNYRKYNILEDLLKYLAESLLHKFKLKNISLSIEKSNKFMLKKIDSVKILYNRTNE